VQYPFRCVATFALTSRTTPKLGKVCHLSASVVLPISRWTAGHRVNTVDERYCLYTGAV
jgi:hypothetical protein